jgi:hypothetical protein
MRKSLSLVLGLMLISAVLAAQTHNNAAEKKASDEVTFKTDVRIGSQVLKAGRYEIACDRNTIKFSLVEVGPGIFTTRTKKLEVPCQGKELTEKMAHTEMSLPVGPDGIPVLAKLLLKGSNVEHVFPN